MNGLYLSNAMRFLAALTNCAEFLMFMLYSRCTNLGCELGWRTGSRANARNEKTPALVRTGLWRTRYGALALTKKESDQLGHGSDATEPMAGRATTPHKVSWHLYSAELFNEALSG